MKELQINMKVWMEVEIEKKNNNLQCWKMKRLDE